MSTLDFDEVLPHIGEIGTYQITLYLLLCIPACLPAAFLAFSQVFLSAEPAHWCAQPELDELDPPLNISQRLRLVSPGNGDVGTNHGYDPCLMYNVTSWSQLYQENGESWPLQPNKDWDLVPCAHGWIFDKSEYENTLVTELELVCDKAWMVSTSTSLFYVGSLVGNVLFGHIADKYGRRFSFFTLLIMEVTLSIVVAFSPNYLVYTVVRTINGLTFPALFQIPFILCLEILGPAYRTMAGMMLCLVFAVALMILAGLAYIFNSWFSLALVISVPFLSLVVYWWIVPESPRWLLSTGRIDEAEVVVQKIARINKKDIPANFIHQLAARASKPASRRQSSATQETKLLDGEDNSSLNISPTVTKDERSICDMMRGYPTARRNFLLINAIWMANSLVYNGLSYYSANLDVSAHLGFFISSAVEIPSYFLGWYAMDKWGRRWVLFETMMIGGLSCISCIFVPPDADPWWTVGLAMIGKFQIACSFAVIYIYAGELMPTVVRSQAMGISSFVAGIGLLIFPYINSLGVISRILPLVIMGGFSCLGGVGALFLPETLWTHLPNTLEEGEAFGSDFNIFSCPSRESAAEHAELQDLARKEQKKNRPVNV